MIFRAWVKARVRKPPSRHSKKSLAAKVYGLAVGFRKRKCLPDRGAPLSSAASKGRPVSFSAKARGLAMVAEQAMNWGREP